jgi:hypothetical protein
MWCYTWLAANSAGRSKEAEDSIITVGKSSSLPEGALISSSNQSVMRENYDEYQKLNQVPKYFRSQFLTRLPVHLNFRERVMQDKLTQSCNSKKRRPWYFGFELFEVYTFMFNKLHGAGSLLVYIYIWDRAPGVDSASNGNEYQESSWG